MMTILLMTFLKNQGGSDASSEMGPPAPDKDKLGDFR